MFKTICWALALISLSCCGVSKAVNLAQSGKATPTTFNREIPFRYIQDHLFMDVEIDGQLYNFLFDTGFDFTVIAEEHQPAGFVKSFDYLTSGTSFEELRVPYGTIPALRIAGVQFEAIGVGIMDLSFINQDYVCEQRVDGVIGVYTITT